MSAHGCVDRINAELAKRNTALASAISFSAPSAELIQVATVRVDTGKRGKGSRAVAMFATFCPFCGVKLNNGAAA